MEDSQVTIEVERCFFYLVMLIQSCYRKPFYLRQPKDIFCVFFIPPVKVLNNVSFDQMSHLKLLIFPVSTSPLNSKIEKRILIETG